jgi:hypothetical protein
MNCSRIALRLREQIHKVAGGFHFLTKPKQRFIEEIIYGIQASKDVKPSEIGRALDEEIALKKTEERLSRHLTQPGLDEKINQHIAKLGPVGCIKRYYSSSTPVIFANPTRGRCPIWLECGTEVPARS